jgi:general secretion pathway protein F
MAEFYYKAARRDGAITQGQVTADSLEVASRQLRSQGLTLIQLHPATGKEVVTGSRAGKPPSRDQVLSFSKELAVMLRAGLPLDRALKVLIDMSVHEGMKSLLEDLLKTVKGGKGLSQAMQAYPDVFGNFYVNMVRSGEASGNLAEVLARLAEYLERAKAVRSSVVSALIYPSILLVVAVLSVTLMLGFVVPQFESLFADMGDALPLLTQGVIWVGEFIRSWGLLLLVVVVGGVFLVRRWVKTPAGKIWLDQRMLKLPVLGGVVFKYEVARFSRTLGTLIGNGVSLLQSLSIALETLDNHQMRTAFEGLAPKVKQGGRISVALAEAEVFSPMVIQMARVGEESGNLGEMMLELASVYDGEVQAEVKRALTLLEPLLILGLAAVIGLIIIAILMGILSVNDLAA